MFLASLAWQVKKKFWINYLLLKTSPKKVLKERLKFQQPALLSVGPSAMSESIKAKAPLLFPILLTLGKLTILEPHLAN